jgi:hypothetical protein
MEGILHARTAMFHALTGEFDEAWSSIERLRQVANDLGSDLIAANLDLASGIVALRGDDHRAPDGAAIEQLRGDDLVEGAFVRHEQRVRRYIELGRQWSAGHRNRMIKVPATPAGIDALEELAASGVTLNVTRRAMAEMGYCPSGRLFEAAACGTPILSDGWEGLEAFFEPGSEILVAHNTDDVIDALRMPEDELAAIARRARERALDEHTAGRRAADLEAALERALRPLD